MKIRPIDPPETSVTNYESTLHDLQEPRSHLHHGGSLKSRVLNGALGSARLLTSFYTAPYRKLSLSFAG